MKTKGIGTHRDLHHCRNVVRRPDDFRGANSGRAPPGKPVKVGVVVATPVFPPGAIQQWIWEAVVPLLRPLKITETSMVFATASMMTSAEPVPVDRVAGFSLAPLSDASKVRVAATGLGALGLLGWRRKRKAAALAA
jgi:hypothetical protein